MPLTAVNFITKGPVLHADLLQFYNLFTGVMLDQPVTFKNVLTLGGNQGTSTVPLKVYGAVGQTSHLIDLYADTGQAQPGFGFGAAGNFGWGPGGASPQDTFLSRVATQNGHATDTAGLLIQPYAEVTGPIQATSFQFPNATALSSTAPLQLTVNQDLVVNRDVLHGRNVVLGTSLTAATPTLHIQGGDPASLLLEAPTSRAMMSAKVAADLGGNLYMNSLAGGWNRYDTTQPAVLAETTANTFSVYGAVAGANPVASIPLYFSVNPGAGVSVANTAFDAYHLRATSYTPQSAGAGFEAYFYASSMVYIIGYNRATNHYLDVTLAGHNVAITPSEGGVLQLPAGSIITSYIASNAISQIKISYYTTISGAVGAGWYETGVGGTATWGGNVCLILFSVNCSNNTVGAVLQYGLFVDGAFSYDCGSVSIVLAGAYINLWGHFFYAPPAGSHRLAVGINTSSGSTTFGRIGIFYAQEIFRG